jgi:putative dehydrogenase
MRQVCVVGVGNMGSGLAKNLIAAGISVKGYDLLEDRMVALAAMGGVRTQSSAEAGEGSEAAFIMVMNGAEVNHVVFGEDGKSGLLSTMKPGSVIILSATIHASEARELGAALVDTGIHLIDTPVSGGYPGAQGGTLTMMAAGSDEALAISHRLHFFFSI